MTPPRLPLVERLSRHVRQTRTCWLWTGGKISTGYGAIRVKGKNILVHRLSYELHVGHPVPKGVCVLHRCDVRNCVNPEHLFLGSKADNVHDMDSKGRRVNGQLRGEHVATAKVTTEMVREMRRRASLGETAKTLMADYPMIGHSNIWMIITGKTWRHVT